MRIDFHDKCYICEMKELQDPQVGHLLPHENGKYPERKFDWDNLFWSCGSCNGVKNQQKYAVGILNCCVDDPEEKISFRLREENVQVEAKDINDKQTVLTALLVQEVFDLKNTGMRVYKSDMRMRELNKEMNILYDNLEAWKREPESKFLLRKLKALLRKESKFAAFKRNYIKENEEKFSELLCYLA